MIEQAEQCLMTRKGIDPHSPQDPTQYLANYGMVWLSAAELET